MTEKTQRSPIGKRQAILDVAGQLFIRDGYKKISMDLIADTVPVSKATLYNHFADKKALFSAVIGARCAAMAAVLEQHLTLSAAPRDVLSAIGRQFLKMITAPDNLKMHRSIIAEVPDFPELGQLFYTSGPQRSHQLLAAYLKKLDQAGQLAVPDAGLATALFFNALKGRQHMECLLGLRATVSAKEQTVLLNYAVDAFLKAHARA